jgi:hypothetical protein
MNGQRFFKRGSRCARILAATAFLSLGGCIWVSPNGQPQQVADNSSPPPPPPESAPPPVDPALQQLVSPIALYPDPILADVLPASTYSDQVQQAAQFIQYNPTPSDDQIAEQNWDPSVQALAHYPSVLQYMAANPQWTQSLGAAFVNQQPQVMEAIQDLRAQAQAVGNLQTTPDEDVDDEGGYIYIRPANDGVIFVPYYDPVLVYSQHDAIDYRYRYRDGAWLDHGFDWQHHDVYTGDWHQGWTGGQGDWHRNPGWAPPPQQWAHDDRRFGPVHQVPPQNYVQPHEVQGRDFHPAPARQAAPQNREPQHVQPPPQQHYDDRPQNQPQPQNQQLPPQRVEHPQNQPHPDEKPSPPARDDTPQNQPQEKPAPVHHDENPQNQPHSQEKPKPHDNPPPPPPPPPPHVKPAPPTAPPPPPPPAHAKPQPPAKPKGPPQKPEGGN